MSTLSFYSVTFYNKVYVVRYQELTIKNTLTAFTILGQCSFYIYIFNITF